MKAMRLRVVGVVCLALLVSLPGALHAAVYLVDQKHPAADDQNPGSAAKPLKTIRAAAAVVKPGDSVLVKPGVYREAVLLGVSGTPQERIVFKAARGPGERVIVSGSDEVKGWQKCTREETRGNPHYENIWRTAIDGEPTAVFVDGQRQRLSRAPAERKERPQWHGFVVANWKANSNFALDLRLAADSPGKGLAEGGRDAGSNADIQAYLRGDFHGDGKRDLPELPEPLQGRPRR